MAGHVRFLAPSGRVATGELRDGRVVASEGTFDQASVRLLPPAEPTKVVGAAGTYVEMLDDPDDPPARPMLFSKPPSAVAGPGSRVTLPTDDILFEGSWPSSWANGVGTSPPRRRWTSSRGTRRPTI
ncbi:hypothetical protein ACFQJD_15155 [Haloplanus sp. GCM10025708]|uniref:hypothetical protein n=1 Tax=Haloplanus sp. GCM10025708 TaxID=3252679 RepID=UPI003611A87B